MVFSSVKSIFLSNPLYFVTDQGLSLGREDTEVVSLVLDAGIKVIQLRDKINLDPQKNDRAYQKKKEDILQKAHVIRQLTQKYKAVFIMNDYVDIALQVGADGVHLGQEDTSIRQTRSMAKSVGKDLFLGKSTHNAEEILQAKADGVDYINIGPLFPTKTKKNAVDPLMDKGRDYVLSLIDLAEECLLPFTVMGGIKKKHLESLWAMKCRHIAMVSEICRQKDIVGHVSSMIATINRLKKH